MSSQSAYWLVVAIFVVFISTVVTSNLLAMVTVYILAQLTKRKLRRLL